VLLFAKVKEIAGLSAAVLLTISAHGALLSPAFLIHCSDLRYGDDSHYLGPSSSKDRSSVYAHDVVLGWSALRVWHGHRQMLSLVIALLATALIARLAYRMTFTYSKKAPLHVVFAQLRPQRPKAASPHRVFLRMSCPVFSPLVRNDCDIVAWR
jgi:hypothetical protein